MPHHPGPAGASRYPAAGAGDPRLHAAVRAAADALTGEPDGAIEAFTARLRRWWPDLVEPLSALYPQAGDLPDRLVEVAARSYRERRPRPAGLGHRADAAPGLAAAALAGGLRRLHRPVRPRPAGGARTFGLPGRARRHLPAPDAAAGATGRPGRRWLRRPGLPPGPVRPGHQRRPGGAGGRPARAGHVTGPGPGAQPRRPRARLGGPGPRRRPPLPCLLPRLPRPAAARRVRADAARGLPRPRPRFVHLGTGDGLRRRLGMDHVQLLPVGPGLVEPGRLRRAGRSRAAPGEPRGGLPAPGRGGVPVEADGHRLPEPARGARGGPGAAGAGAGGGPCRGLQGRGHRLPRTAARLSGDRPLGGQGQRPRLPQQPDGADLVLAGQRGRRAGLAGPGGAPAQAGDRHLATYARCHDDIGWAVSDADAAAVGLDGHRHRLFLARWYRGHFPGSWSRGADFQADATTGDARTSGTAASLCGVQSALESGDEQALDAALGRLFLVHALVYGFGGIPLLYKGDELGQLNDVGYADEPARRDDSRWLHRPRLDAEAMAARHDPTTVAGRVFGGIRHLARVRAGLASLHAAVESEPVESGAPAVLALRRRHPAGTLVQLYNMSASWQRVPVDALRSHGLDRPQEHLSSFVPEPDDDGWRAYALPPYAAWWLTEHEL